MPLMPRASSQEATRVVLPAPGGPTTQIAGLCSRASSSLANSRSRATALCRRGRVSFASCGTRFGSFSSPWSPIATPTIIQPPAEDEKVEAHREGSEAIAFQPTGRLENLAASIYYNNCYNAAEAADVHPQTHPDRQFGRRHPAQGSARAAQAWKGRRGLHYRVAGRLSHHPT